VTASSPKGLSLTGRALESARAFDDVVVEESDPSDLVRLDDPRDLGCEKHVGFVVEVADVHHHSTLFVRLVELVIGVHAGVARVIFRFVALVAFRLGDHDAVLVGRDVDGGDRSFFRWKRNLLKNHQHLLTSSRNKFLSKTKTLKSDFYVF
jgi:hypothetical protein